MLEENKLVPIILAGGKGARLWPLSRENYPKAFCSLIDGQSLLQHTILRACRLLSSSNPVIVSNEAHQFLISQQIEELNLSSDLQLIFESQGRDTAPSVTLAALELLQKKTNPILLVLPSDHLISSQAEFINIVDKARRELKKDQLVCFGIKPTHPDTGYGYIKSGCALSGGEGFFDIELFVEKPSIEIAKKYIGEGEVYWNSGIFMFYASDFIEELKKYSPEIFEYCNQAIKNAQRSMNIVKPEAASFERSEAISIDYAVMEKTKHGVLFPTDMTWSDLGSWQSLWENGAKDDNNNVIKGDILAKRVDNSYIYSDYRFVAALGIENCVIVDTKDALLVANKSSSKEIKEISSYLTTKKRDEAVSATKVYRPWGSYEYLNKSENFLIKKLTIDPGHSISLQYHHQRSEHWVVVRGVADVIKGSNQLVLNEGESIFIPPKAIHRLSNKTSELLEIIEIQLGTYLCDDDIIRLEDNYGRVEENKIESLQLV